MIGWHHQLNGHELEQTLGDGEGQGSLRAAVHGIAKGQTPLSNKTTKENEMPGLQEREADENESLKGPQGTSSIKLRSLCQAGTRVQK